VANGRDERGRFAKGNSFGRLSNAGRPRKADRDDLRATIDANVSEEAVAAAWKRVEAAMKHGGRGWLDLFKLWLDYRYGRPAQFHHVMGDDGGPVELHVTLSKQERIAALAGLIEPVPREDA
jgi:hypothetical protein